MRKRNVFQRLMKLRLEETFDFYHYVLPQRKILTNNIFMIIL